MVIFLNFLTYICDILWNKIGVTVILCCGLFLSIRLKFFQLFKFPSIIKTTLGSFSSNTRKKYSTVSPFGALCTTLAATLGVGNISGVASALYLGGAGAVFWMWVSAFLGMATAYSENCLAVIYRKRQKDTFVGGAMYYLRDGLKIGGKTLSVIYAVCTVFVAFFMGNTSQINAISDNLSLLFPQFLSGRIYLLLLGVLLSAVVGFCVSGGTKRIIKTCERIIPAMVLLFLAGALTVIFKNADKILPAFCTILKSAFGLNSVAGGAVGHSVKTAVNYGLRRGVFSNEAGLGSSAAIGASSEESDPAAQGLWGALAVFIDTTVMCTLTALLILCAGFVDLKSGIMLPGISASTLTAKAFGTVFGAGGNVFVAVCVLIFAFSTVIGWSHIGASAVTFLFGSRYVSIFNFLFIALIIPAAAIKNGTAFLLADLANALLLLPNTIGLFCLSDKIINASRNHPLFSCKLG